MLNLKVFQPCSGWRNYMYLYHSCRCFILESGFLFPIYDIILCLLDCCVDQYYLYKNQKKWMELPCFVCVIATITTFCGTLLWTRNIINWGEQTLNTNTFLEKECKEHPIQLKFKVFSKSIVLLSSHQNIESKYVGSTSVLQSR